MRLVIASVISVIGCYLEKDIRQSYVLSVVQKLTISILAAFVSLSLAISPSLGKGPGMPEGDSLTKTSNPESDLPVGIKISLTREGDVLISVENGKILMSELVPKDATEEEKRAAQGYIVGYIMGLRASPQITEEYVKLYSNESSGQLATKPARVGFMLGVQAALESQEVYRKLISDTLEGLGVQRIDQLPQLKVSPPPVTSPIPNEGPPT